MEWPLALLSLSKKVLELIARPGSFAGWPCIFSLCLHGLAGFLPQSKAYRGGLATLSRPRDVVCVSVWQPCDGLSWMPVSIFIQNTWIRYVYSNFAMLATPIILLFSSMVWSHEWLFDLQKKPMSRKWVTLSEARDITKRHRVFWHIIRQYFWNSANPCWRHLRWKEAVVLLQVFFGRSI